MQQILNPSLRNTRENQDNSTLDTPNTSNEDEVMIVKPYCLGSINLKIECESSYEGAKVYQELCNLLTEYISDNHHLKGKVTLPKRLGWILSNS